MALNIQINTFNPYVSCLEGTKFILLKTVLNCKIVNKELSVVILWSSIAFATN